MANSVNPDETAHYEPSHLAVFAKRFWSVGLKGLRRQMNCQAEHKKKKKTKKDKTVNQLSVYIFTL